MKILIVNDDGIHAPGLQKLAKWAQKLGEIFIVAPKYEQSAKSHSIEIRNPFEAAPCPLPEFPGVEAWAVDSLPAECVKWAINGLGYDPDIVFTGINNGFNIGVDILYSATAGAAAEAVLFGKKSVAFSSGHNHIDYIGEKDLDAVWRFVTDKHLLDVSDFWNINVPRDWKDIRFTRQGGRVYQDRFEKVEGNIVRYAGYKSFQNRHDEHVDVEAVEDGYVSISPLTIERTDFEVLKKFI